jgi:signal transduction histidine kinase
VASNSRHEALHFDINAAVVFRLGEELITDVVQALVELVKNSYDADATWVKVTIDTQAKTDGDHKFSDTSGVIRVEDNGEGMDEVTIRNGWLTIASSQKREDKAAGRVTRRGRTPIGDKGLGRLGVQRLAHNVEIVTRPQADEVTDEYYVAFSWKDFRDTANLSEVPLTFKHRTASVSKHGTTLILSALREPHAWQDGDYLKDLRRKLSGMISPFQEARDFLVHLEVDGVRLELAEIAQRVRETALLKYTFDFDGEIFRISGIARLEYLMPGKKEDQQIFRSLSRRDGGEALFKFLANEAGKRRPRHFVLSERAGWFVEFGEQRYLKDLDNVRRVDGVVANPGVFRGEVDAIALDNSDYKSHAFDRKSDLRRMVKDLTGIRVYRDGFGIRVGEDWLGLGKQQTGGKSFYGLRPGNVLGFVAISARDNPNLLETTSREGFQVTPHYENFFDLLSEFVRYTGNTQEFLRRGVLQFLSQHLDRDADVEPDDTYSKITQRIDDVAGNLSSEKGKVQSHAGTLRNAATKASMALGHVRDEIDESLFKDNSVAKALLRLEEVLKEVSSTAVNAEKMLEDVSIALDRASELKSLREVLDRRWETLHDEVSALYESISLGLTAEALSHEIHNIADGLARRSSALLSDVMNDNARKASVITFIEHVRSSVAAMRKQLAHLTPSLRFLRERRERIEIYDFALELAEFFNNKLCAKKIVVKVEQGNLSAFSVYMNKGMLTQVFDNLILNSQYWIKEAIRAGYVKEGLITIVVEHPVLRLMDNGLGVEESVEESVFEPFVTTKRSGEGRGLGLFVVRQLLDSVSCGIILLPDRNASGRRYIFELDLSGAERD